MSRPTDDEMVVEVLKWLDEATVDEQIVFKNSSFKDLHDYHFSLCAHIRNHFKLWQYSWEPIYCDSVDHSPEHPDAISMRVLYKVWQKIKETA